MDDIKVIIHSLVILIHRVVATLFLMWLFVGNLVSLQSSFSLQ